MLILILYYFLTCLGLLILKKLINGDVKLDVEDKDKRTAMLWAASSGK